MMMAAVANSAPTASPSMGTPDQTTGQITGNVNATDVDGNPMTYTVPTSGAGAPTRGTVSVNQTTGAFTYKPTAAARTAAGISAGADFDTFTVTVSDGQGGVTPVSVQVAVLPGVFENSNTPGSAQANPSGVAIVGNRAYVANQGTNTVSVLDAATGAAVGSPIVVGSAPTGVAASPDGSKVYVTNRTSGSVSVIRTSDNKVVNTITVGTQPESVTFSTDGTRAYVTNYGSKSVSVIDATLATPKVITTISNVGTNPRGIAYVQTANGPRVYVANSGAGTVSVINASTNKLIDTKPSTALTVDPISVGSAPQQIAVSPDGTRIYVTNQSSNSVSVINTATNALDGAAIAVGSKPAGIALSADGSTLYVANGDDSVFVVDTKTRSVFGVMTLDNAPENNLHAVAVRGDGSLLVTDLADRAVRIVNYKRGNTAPVATGSPTVGTPSLGNGAVIGNVNITDWDGDPLTYTTVTAPTKGSVSFNPASGTYTYTPTQAARDAAVQTPGLTDTFSVRATDPYGAYVSTASITVPILSSATNHAPTAPGYQYFDPTDSVTGEVRGRIIASDPDGNPLSYQVISGPWSASSFTFNSATGEFSYIPSQEKREYVTQWPGYDDYDYFQVVVSDGTASVSTSVNVLVSPIQMAPTAYYPPEVGSADPATGRVSGSMNVYDPNGDTVAYAISSGPSRGTATVNAATGIYTYTPSSSERSVGGLDSFTVTATDGHDTSTFVVTVPVRAPELASSQTQIPLPGSGPNIALSGSRAYVFNKYLWTVSSIDTNTNTVIRTSQPLASGSTLSYPGNVAVSPDGTRVYVANWVEGKIIQLDPNTLAPVGQPIAVAGGGDDMVFSPDGTRLYVANDGAPGSLTVIDTNSRSVVGTIPTTYDTTDMAMSSDGRTLYLADGYYNRIQVLDTNTKSVVGYIPLGSQSYNGNPGGIALSPDGRWAYVTDPDNATVSVIDLTSRTVVGDPIVVGVPRWEASTVSWPTAIAVSADGTRVYVANGDDIVVIDAATRKVVGAVRFPGYVSDSSARATQTLAVYSNGDLLIYGGNGLTSVSLGASGSQMT
jgi:YVTN family beta-propeller protein/VCBS repeat-containing protein